MSDNNIKYLAQRLIELKRQEKNMEDEVLQLKLTIWDAAKGGIDCEGGKIYWIEPGTEMRFNIQELKKRLKEQGLSENQINDLIEASKVINERDPQIRVVLNED